MYAIWLKVDESLPWIELEHTCGTKREAKKAIRELHVKAKVIRVSTDTQAVKSGKLSVLHSEVEQVLV